MSKKVLVIENNLASSKLMQYALIKHGYEVLVSSNGWDGLKKARAEKPDLVILEGMLPGMDGFEVCHQLRTKGNALPMVLLSEEVSETDKAAGLKLGACEYLVKPVLPSLIVSVVDSLLLSAPRRKRTMKTEKRSDK